MLPLFSFLDHLIPLFCHLFLSHFIHFGLAFFLYSFHSPSPSHWKWTFHNASFLFCHKIKPIYPPSSLSLSFSPSITSLASLLALFTRPSSETTGELLLKSTERSTIKRNRRKDRFFLHWSTNVGRKNKCVSLHWMGMRWGLRDSLRVNAVRAVELSSTLHVYCCLFTALLLFLCPSCPPSEHVLFSQLLIIEITTLKLRHKLH